MNFCTVTWDLDRLAAVHAANRDAVVVVTVVKALTDAIRRRAQEDVPEVTLTRQRMGAFGLSPRRFRQALRAVSDAGFATVRQESGQATRVTLDPSFFRGLKARKAGGWELA
jgi:hypothetical protein